MVVPRVSGRILEVGLVAADIIDQWLDVSGVRHTTRHTDSGLVWITIDQKTKLLQMDRFGQCGPACLAMVLGITLEDAMTALKMSDPDDGSTDDSMVAVLMAHGYRNAEVVHNMWAYTNGGADPFPPSILGVPSLNVTGLLHFVYWDGDRILDPACGEKHWPEDAPVVKGQQVPVQWVSAIVLGKRSR